MIYHATLSHMPIIAIMGCKAREVTFPLATQIVILGGSHHGQQLYEKTKR